MNRPTPRRSAVVAVLALLAGLTHARATWRAEVETIADSGVSIELTSPFEDAPPTGTLPVWVTIRNASGAARTWTFGTNSSSRYDSGSRHVVTESLRVESGQTARVPVLIPLDVSTTGYYYHSNSFQAEGYGVSERPSPLPQVKSQTKSNPTPSIGMGEDLATPIWASLTKWYTDKGQDLLGSPLDLEQLNGDWRMLAGLDTLWLSDASYDRLDATRRTAVRDWVSHGGLLCLCTGSANPALRAALGLGPEGDSADVGLGRVQLVAWDGQPLPAETVAAKENQPRATRADPAAAAATDWPMTQSVGAIPLNALFLIAVIVVFAVLVGPVNLFVFARSTHRHRLFWTTPLISVAASLLLMVFILLKDGFGGSGKRALLCILLPDQKKTVVVQEQIARTGVVLSHGFDVAEDLLLSPLQLADGPSRSQEQTGRHFSGEWFASRSRQAQRADAVVPSRAEITLVNADAAHDGAPPVLTSSVPAAIRRITYLDPAGRQWVGDGLRTGERVTLRTGGVEEGAFSTGGSEGLDAEVKHLLERRGGFVALADDGPFLETLPSIHWTNQRAVFAGPVTGAR